MIGTRKLGKPNPEKFCSEIPRKTPPKKLQLQKSQTQQETAKLQRKVMWFKTATSEITAEKDVVKTVTSEATTENDVVQTATNINTEGDRTPSDNVTSFDLDISDNLYILAPPPIQSPPQNSRIAAYRRWI